MIFSTFSLVSFFVTALYFSGTQYRLFCAV